VEFELRFVITESAGKFGVGVAAVDAAGARLTATPAPLMDRIFSAPDEAADVVLGMLRGAITNRRGAFERDELGIGKAIAKAR
jgi:hypothetical protein